MGWVWVGGPHNHCMHSVALAGPLPAPALHKVPATKPPSHQASNQASPGPGHPPSEKLRTSPAPSSVAAAPLNLDLNRPSSRSTHECQACSTSCCSSRLSCRKAARRARGVHERKECKQFGR